MAGRRYRLEQVIGLALVAGAAASAQAAPVKSQGWANASAMGIAKANGNSVLASGATTSNGNGNGKSSGSATSSSSSSAASNSSTASNGNGNSNASSNSAASNGNGNASSNGSSASSNAPSNGNGNSGSSASSGAAGGAPGGSATVTAPADPAVGVTYSVDVMTVAASSYDFYRLFSGNDSKGIDGLDKDLGTGWTLAAKDNTDSGDDVANVVDGVFFHVNAGAKATSGQWTLTGTGEVLGTGPILVDMVAVLKSSTEYGAYYFEHVAFDGSGGGSWLSPSLNAKGDLQELSHLSIYLRQAGGMSMPGGGTSGGLGGSAGTPVPEPGSLALASLGLVALGWARRKAARRG